jgi:hypothetical protein
LFFFFNNLQENLISEVALSVFLEFEENKLVIETTKAQAQEREREREWEKTKKTQGRKVKKRKTSHHTKQQQN